MARAGNNTFAEQHCRATEAFDANSKHFYVWCSNHFELHRRWNRHSQFLRHAPRSLLARGRVVDDPIFSEQLLAGVQCVFNVAQERCDSEPFEQEKPYRARGASSTETPFRSWQK